jgi:hypothetical protein
MDTRKTQGGIDRPNGGHPHSSDELLWDIRQTRGQMDRTLDELGERLQPRHLLDDVIDHFWRREEQTARKTREAASRVSHQVASQIREHPLPSFLIGAGLLWLLAEQSERVQRAESRAVQKVKDKAGEATGALKERAHEMSESGREGASQMGAEAKERIGETWESAKGKGQKLQERMQTQMRQAGESVRQTAENHPLAIGLGCLAIGVIAGAMAPRTRMEDEMMGDASGRIKDEAMEQGRELAREGREVAEHAIESGKKEAHQKGLDAEGLAQRAEEASRPGEPPPGGGGI